MGADRASCTTSTTSGIRIWRTATRGYALRELEARGYPPELVRAVASHADFLGVSRDSPMEKALFAVDELSGFMLACAYVRPEGLQGMTPKSVKKKLKQPSFAAAVNRDELRHGAEELGVDFDEHLTIVIGALAGEAGRADARRRGDGDLMAGDAGGCPGGARLGALAAQLVLGEARDHPERLEQPRELDRAPHRPLAADHGQAPPLALEAALRAQQDRQAERVDELGPAQVDDGVTGLLADDVVELRHQLPRGQDVELTGHGHHRRLPAWRVLSAS